LVQALADDILVYVCLLVFVDVIGWLLGLFRAGPEHEGLHKWAFLAIDGVIVFGLIRKIAILVMRE